jgi:hypothetical protein
MNNDAMKILKSMALPEGCIQSAYLLARQLGGNAKVMHNGRHAFVVFDGHVHDATTGTVAMCGSMYVREKYGNKKNWKEIA